MKKIILLTSLAMTVSLCATNVVPSPDDDPLNAQIPGRRRNIQQSRIKRIAYPPTSGYYWYRPYKGSYYYPRYLYYPFYNDHQDTDHIYYIK